MGFDPNQPRDEEGKWEGGKVRRLNRRLKQDNVHPNQKLARQIKDQAAADAYETSQTHMTPMGAPMSMEEYNSRIEEAKRRGERGHKFSHTAMEIAALTHPEFGGDLRRAWAPRTDAEVRRDEARWGADRARWKVGVAIKSAAIARGMHKKDASKFMQKVVPSISKMQSIIKKANRRIKQ